jgi:hypothetical protein
MQLNQILLDILDWIRRVLWSKKLSTKKKPYAVIDTFDGVYGQLKLVERDTPRAVMTYIFTPRPVIKGNKVYNQKDYHICLDYLGLLDNQVVIDPKSREKKARRIKYGEPSHSITVLEASRWVDKDGNYKSNIIYHKLYDFLGKEHEHTHKYACMVFRDVCNLLKHQDIKYFEWEQQVDWSKKIVMPTKLKYSNDTRI